MYNYESDILVIGGGGAGAMAAYEASKHCGSVVMALKGRPQRCGSTIMAPGAIAGVGSWHVPGDSRDSHFADTVRGGGFLGEQGLIRIMVEEAPDLILELERIGALWERQGDGRTYALRTGGGHSFYRCTYMEDRTGREMLRPLLSMLQKRNVRILPDLMILRLIKSKDRICGALGIRLENCEPVLLRAKVIILACGGAGNLYSNTSNPTDVAGDGYALALEAGAALMDMEFVQFFPVGFCFPLSLRGALAALPAYVHLWNSKGERFMEKHDPVRLELSTRDRVSRAMYTEIKEGRGGPHRGVFADMTYHETGFIARMQPALCETYRKIGFDPEKDFLEVAPTCHFFMGGVKVDDRWESTVPGLFVVGENAAGIQGANRLSQNALPELLVSGKRAGKAAAQRATEMASSPIDPREVKAAFEPMGKLLSRDGGPRPIVLRNQLRKLMWDDVGVYRTESGLKKALDKLQEIGAELDRQSAEMTSKHYNRELVEGLENYFLVSIAICVAKGALWRTESRGAHYREDYPKTDNRDWLKHQILTLVDDDLVIDITPVDLREMPADCEETD
jgi:succinate dehydrogenase/fumarate reductase flavoprotein subunit